MKKLIFIVLTFFMFINSGNAANLPAKVIKAEIKELIINLKGGSEFVKAYEIYSTYYNEWYPAKQEMEFFQKLRKMKINATNTTTLSYTKEKILSVKNTCTHHQYIETQLRLATKELNNARNYLKKNSKTTKGLTIASYDIAELMTTKSSPKYFLTPAISCDKVSKQADTIIAEIDKKLQ